MAATEVALSKRHLLKMIFPVCVEQPCFLSTQPLSSAKGEGWLMGEESCGERHISHSSQQHGDGGDPGQEAELCPAQGRQGESPWDPQEIGTVGKIWGEDTTP